MSRATEGLVEAQLAEAVSAHVALAARHDIVEQLTRWGDWCVDSILAGSSILFAGNGGSFADAQHLAAELTGKMGRVRDPIPGIALGTNASSMTAIGNDFDYQDVFARECRALANSSSVVILLSTSGNSKNILRLADAAQDLGARVLGLTGESGGLLATTIETIRVPSNRTERIQEMHILLGHTLCLLIEEALVFAPEAGK